MRMTPDPTVDGAAAVSPLLEISGAMVRLYKATFGRGPTHARARFAGDDTLVVLLQDIMTHSERKLVELDEHQRLRELRLVLHQAMEADMRRVVERILGRPTLAAISGIDARHDVAAEVFLLAPDLRVDGAR